MGSFKYSPPILLDCSFHHYSRLLMLNRADEHPNSTGYRFAVDYIIRHPVLPCNPIVTLIKLLYKCFICIPGHI